MIHIHAVPTLASCCSYLSVDPYMRGRMRNAKGYFMAPFTPGQPVTSRSVARVVTSRAAAYTAGDVVSGLLPWSTHAVLGPDGQVRCIAQLRVS